MNCKVFFFFFDLEYIILFFLFLEDFFVDYLKQYGVIVIGGGYVGMEVVLVSVCMGVVILLLIYNIEILGQMFCNFVIGGIGKSYLVKEIDVLDGVMVWVIDKGGI